ncbi:MAG TPA: epoxide hydrolase [Thermoanaerobaculia bacterium]|nr:epoxide hydrolase [Thermoanaerobaculia bacterium]
MPRGLDGDRAGHIGTDATSTTRDPAGGAESTVADDVVPFRVEVPEDELADLRRRLRATRWPDPEPVDDWSQGMPLAYLQEVCRYWAEEYDWRACEESLNSLPQLRTVIEGLGIHFVHVRSRHPEARPLVITHGWPGSILEFRKSIGPLTDPTSHGGSADDAFHLVLPSLPGFGFSDKPTTPGWTQERIADAWAVLMRRLGYRRYFAQGGDWGAAITADLGARDPEGCAGLHVNMAVVRPDPATMDDLTTDEKRALAAMKRYRDWDSGYSKQQSTRPQTVGYGLVDSPAGQAAWILEKFWSWTDCDGHPENVLTRDELLDNVMTYWLPRAAASSARLYWESFGKGAAETVEVPAGYTRFPKELFHASRRWMEKRFTQIVYWNELDRGGHFAALEQPEAFVSELRSAFREMSLD